MNNEQGYVRVVNIRADDNYFRTYKAERVIMMDRANPTIGNRHVMKGQSRLERERVILISQAFNSNPYPYPGGEQHHNKPKTTPTKDTHQFATSRCRFSASKALTLNPESLKKERQ